MNIDVDPGSYNMISQRQCFDQEISRNLTISPLDLMFETTCSLRGYGLNLSTLRSQCLLHNDLHDDDRNVAYTALTALPVQRILKTIKVP